MKYSIWGKILDPYDAERHSGFPSSCWWDWRIEEKCIVGRKNDPEILV
jgi:hypothetical protein